LRVLGARLNGRLNKTLFNIRKLALNFSLVISSFILTSYSFSASSDENSIRSESKSTSIEAPKDISILIKQIADEQKRKTADEQQRKYMERPRRRSTEEKAHYDPVEMYVEKWREKVEKLVKVNYPIDTQTPHLLGNVMLSVSIKADGTVEAAKIIITSGHKILDDHVLNTIRKAAPFEQFSEELNNYADILTIEKTWVHLSEPSVAETESSFLKDVERQK
jgi:TonB family protein